MRSTLMVLALLLLTAASASAWICPDPDNMAIYVDDGGVYSPCVRAHDFDTLDLVMVVGNPSGDQVVAWEATVTDPDPAAAVGAWQLPYGYTDFGHDLGDGTHSHAVAYLHPALPDANGLVELMRASIVVMDHDVPMEFYIRAYPESTTFDDMPGYISEPGAEYPCGVVTGDYDLPSCVINGVCRIVADERMTWGRVKSLY